jgi:hypothetical protein
VYSNISSTNNLLFSLCLPPSIAQRERESEGERERERERAAERERDREREIEREIESVCMLGPIRCVAHGPILELSSNKYARSLS